MPTLPSPEYFKDGVVEMTLPPPCLYYPYLFLAALAALLRVPLLLLFGLQRREVNVPEQNDLEDNSDEHDQQDREQNRLVVQDSDGLGRGANGAEPVELTHFGDHWSVPMILDFGLLSGK